MKRDYYPKPRFDWRDLIGPVLCFLLLACIPFGIGMAIYTNNGQWLWLCMVLIFFLS